MPAVEKSTNAELENSIEYVKQQSIGVRVENLPKRSAQSKDLQKIIDTFELAEPVLDIQKIKGRSFGTITCLDEAQQKILVEKFSGFRWKNADQFILRAREVVVYQREARLTPFARELLLNDKLTPSEKLANQVTPLWANTYDEQLQIKSDWARDIASKLELNEETLEPIVASPVINSYRSKIELTFGKNLNDEPEAGFLLGLFRHGLVAVISPQDCLHVSEPAKRIAAVLSKFVKTQHPVLQVYDRAIHTGCWRLALVRTQHNTGENMVVLQYNPVRQDPIALDKSFSELRELFSSEKQSDGSALVTSLLVQSSSSRHHGFLEGEPCRLLAGERPFIFERLLNLSFRVSPSSFFQINTLATELLYKSACDRVAKGCDNGKKTIVLDLCCGTGTIGIAMAPHVEHVIGVEMVASAVEDAKLNAKLNKLEDKMTFICAKLEDALPQVEKLLHSLFTDYALVNIVAIVDPPRAGLHSSVVQTLLQWTFIERMVYISCDANQAIGNFKAFLEAESDKFEIASVQPFDLFPHTKHCEMILEFFRKSSQH